MEFEEEDDNSRPWLDFKKNKTPFWMVPLVKADKIKLDEWADDIATCKAFIQSFSINYSSKFFQAKNYSIIDSLSLCPLLGLLSLKDTGLSDEGCKAVRDFIVTSPACTKLVLSQNNITKVGIELIAQALPKNTSIKSLDVSKNPLEDAGIILLAKGFGFAGNKSIEDLWIQDTKFTTVGQEAIEMMLTENECLAQIFYKEPAKSQAVIKKCLENNQKNKEKFLRDLKGEHKGRWNRSKLMFIGQGRAGKTSTVNRLLNKKFEEQEDSTVGASVSQTQTSTTKREHWKPLDASDTGFLGQGMKPNAAVNDIAAKNIINKQKQKAEAKLKEKEKPKPAKKAVVRKQATDFNFEELDIDAQKEEEDEAKKLEEMNKARHEKDKKKFGKYGFGDEGELNFGESAKGQQFVEEEITTKFSDALFMEASDSKETINFALWDYGGQTVFYALHHLFLTKYGIYVLCFDMREVLNRPKVAEEYLMFWLNSVKLHAPEAPVFMVGTYLDAVDEKKDIDIVNEFVKEKFSGKFPQLISLRNDLKFFPVDNKNNRNVKELRGWIEVTTRDQEFVKAQVSLRWLGCLDKIMNMKDKNDPEGKKSPAWLTLAQVREISHLVGMKSESELEDMLEMFHELGVIVRLTGTEDLRNLVTLDPQWLVDGLCRVIRDQKLHHLDQVDIEKSGLEKDVKQLYDKGLASRDLMEYLWKDDKFNKHVDFLLDLMKYMVLISDWNFRNEPLYVVPSLLERKPEDEDEINLFSNQEKELSALREKEPKSLTSEETARIAFLEKSKELEENKATDYAVFDFKEIFLPMGVFQRLVCLCVSYSTLVGGNKFKNEKNEKASEPILYSRWAKIWMGKDIILFLEQRDDEIWVSVEHEDTANTCLKAVKSMLGKLNSELMGSGLKWSVKFLTVRKTVKQKKGEKATVTEVVEKEVKNSDAKKQNLRPWFEAKKKVDKKELENDMLNLGDFVNQLLA